MLGHFEIKQCGTGSGDAGQHPFHAESFERADTELGADFLVSRIGHERPRVKRGDAGAPFAKTLPEAIHEGSLHQHFVRSQRAEEHLGVVERALCELEGTRRNIEKGHTDLLSAKAECRQIVILAGLEQIVIVSDAGGDELRDAPFHQFFCEFRILQLVADSYFVAGLHESGHVVVDGVVGDAGHFDESAAAGGLARQHKAEHAAGRERIFAVGFVEVADAVEEQGFGILGFDLEVLLEHRGLWRVFLFHR